MNKAIRTIWYFFQTLRGLYSQWGGLRNKDKYGRLGRASYIGSGSTLATRNMFLDDFTVVQNQNNFISLGGQLEIGKYSVISSGCTIVASSHVLTVGVPFYVSTQYHINDIDSKVIIKEDVWVGAACVLLPGCTIGRGAVVGAGCIVKKNVPPYAVVVGVPAKVIASKFTKEQIIAHERILYPVELRMSENQIDNLFEEFFKGKPSIGKDFLSDDDSEYLRKIREDLGMKDYSKD